MSANWEAEYENKQKKARAIDQLAVHGIAEKTYGLPAVGGRKIKYDADDTQSVMMHNCVARYHAREDSNDEDFPEDADIDPLVWQRTTNRNGKVTAMRISRYSKLPQPITDSLTDGDLAMTIRLSRMHQSRIFEAGKMPVSTLVEPDFPEEDENEPRSDPRPNKGKHKREEDEQSVQSNGKRSKGDERPKEISSKPSSNGRGKRKAIEAFEEEDVGRTAPKRTKVTAFNEAEPTLPPDSAPAAQGERPAISSGRRASRRVVNANGLLQAGGERARPLQNGVALREALRAKGASNGRMDYRRAARTRPRTHRPTLIARLRIQLWDANDDPIVHGMLPKQAQAMMEATAPETLSAMQEWVQKHGPYAED